MVRGTEKAAKQTFFQYQGCCKMCIFIKVFMSIFYGRYSNTWYNEKVKLSHLTPVHCRLRSHFHLWLDASPCSIFCSRREVATEVGQYEKQLHQRQSRCVVFLACCSEITWKVEELEGIPHYIFLYIAIERIQWCRYWLTFWVAISNTFFLLPIPMNSFQLRTPAIYSCHPFSSLLSCFLLRYSFFVPLSFSCVPSGIFHTHLFSCLIS